MVSYSRYFLKQPLLLRRLSFRTVAVRYRSPVTRFYTAPSSHESSDCVVVLFRSANHVQQDYTTPLHVQISYVTCPRFWFTVPIVYRVSVDSGKLTLPTEDHH
jgi:hypothetical protein